MDAGRAAAGGAVVVALSCAARAATAAGDREGVTEALVPAGVAATTGAEPGLAGAGADGRGMDVGTPVTEDELATRPADDNGVEGCGLGTGVAELGAVSCALGRGAAPDVGAAAFAVTGTEGVLDGSVAVTLMAGPTGTAGLLRST